MHYLVVDSRRINLIREIVEVFGDVGIKVNTPPAKDRRPMLRLPDGRWIHGRKKILQFAEELRSIARAS
jgi:hypothetical protein